MSRLNELQDEKWFQVLSAEVKKSSKSEVARLMGYSRTTISLVMSGKYDGGTTAIAAKVMETFTDLVACPYLNADINKGQCWDHQSRPMPSSDPNQLRHWMSCRSECPHSSHSIEEDLYNA